MDEVLRLDEPQIARLLGEHYEEVTMESAFRTALLDRTRRLVSARTRPTARRWALALAGGLILAAAALALWHTRGGTPPTPSERPDVRVVAPAEDVSPTVPAADAAQGPTEEQPALAAAPAEETPPRPKPALAVIAGWGDATDASGKRLAVGDRIRAGSIVQTGPEGRLTLVTHKGSEFTLDERTKLAIGIGMTTARLLGGRLYCRSRRAEIARIETNPGVIELLGTTLDASVEEEGRVAVTVLDGQVRLRNEHGEAVVEAGRRAIMVASRPPQPGEAVDTFAATAWYDGRGKVISDFGDIAYIVVREDAQGLATEVWAMNADGSNKRRLKTFLGYGRAPGPWLPGQQWLLVNAHSALWTQPDFEARRAHAGAGHPIVDDQAWLLNAVTGQDLAFDLPPGYDPLYTALSPNGTRLAFCGSYQPDPADRETMEGGIWVYDLATGQVKKLLDGFIKTAPSWAPDSRRLVASKGVGYGTHHPLVVVDTDTGEVTDLGINGAGANFSPDGTKIAYNGDFQSGGTWYAGVPDCGRILVLGLSSTAEPVPITAVGDEAVNPAWSPDGTRLAYRVDHTTWDDPDEGRGHHPLYALFVGQADGSHVQKIHEAEETLRGFAWAPSGDALYTVTDKGVKLIAADGSGVIADLGGDPEDSRVSEQAEAQTDAALTAVQEAIFQYALGNVRLFEGKPDECKAAFKAAADIFAGIPWECPLANLSLNQLLLYADKAEREASPSKAELLSESCRRRMDYYFETLLVQCAAAEGAFPASLDALEQSSLGTRWGINWTSYEDTDWVHMMFRCPVAGPFAYTPPADGDPEIGDVIATCSAHPDHKLVWTEQLAQRLEWHRQSAAHRAIEEDPELQKLAEAAEETRDRAAAGTASWQDVEAAYRALLDEVPNHVMAREYYGRILTRQGRFREALDVLPPRRPGWSALHRAFCLDALGERDKAVAIYQELSQNMAGTTIGLWAERGLKEPTWLQDLDIPALPGEVRLTQTDAWHAFAWAPTQPSKPEFAIDGDRETPWTVGGKDHGQEPGMWFRLDFDAPVVVSRIVLDHHGEGTIFVSAWPRGVKAGVTTDGEAWREVPVTQGGIMQPVEVRFDPSQTIRGIRFESTGTNDPEGWDIHEVFVFAPAGERSPSGAD